MNGRQVGWGMSFLRQIWALVSLAWVPGRWRLASLGMLALGFGLALAVARAARMTSYLSDAPETCINCHVMNDAYLSWQHGSHRHVAVCNDCHVPHTSPVAQYAFKGRDGMRHSYVFTLHLEPQVLNLSAGAIPVIQGNCLRCHAAQIQNVRLPGTEERRCWDCHTNVHGKSRSLSASPDVMRPRLPSAGLPHWHDDNPTGGEPLHE